MKASIVEKSNRTLKEKKWKYFTDMGNNRYIDVLDKLVYNYNHFRHRSIKMTPIEASKQINSAKVYKKLYSIEPEFFQFKVKFEISDKIRISKYKNVFQTFYIGNFTEEIFTISQIIPSNPTTYKIKIYKNEEIQGIFYQKELTKYNKQDNQYEIESILKTKNYPMEKLIILLNGKGIPRVSTPG